METNEPISENLGDSDPLQKPKKQRPPMTQKAKDAIEAGRKKRLENCAIITAQKAINAKKLLDEKKALKVPPKPPTPPEAPPSASVSLHICDNTPLSESEEELVETIFQSHRLPIQSHRLPKVVQKKETTKKKKQRKVIIYEESSSEEEEEEEEEEIYLPQLKKQPLRDLKPQQNRRSAIKSANEIQTTQNFFCS